MLDRRPTEDRHVLTLVAQPQYPKDAQFADLPDHLVRKCCVGRECGNVGLVKTMVSTKDVSGFAYRRVDTGDLYFGPYEYPMMLVAMLNRDTFWPIES
jgi:hypothetical protein